MAEQRQDKAALISETRRRFEADYLPDKSDKYDSRDVERLQQDDKWVENYLIWRHDVVDDTLKMIDESFQWRKEYTVNDLTESVLPKWLFENGALFLHGYDKEGYKLFWFRVKHHTRDPKQQLEKKKLVAFWLEHYAKRDHGKPLTVVFDMAETGISHIDLDFVRFIVNCFTDYYPNFLTKIVIFEMPWIMNAAFKIVKGWLGPDAISMLKFTNKNDVQEYISGEYLPPHMGGTDSFKYSYPPLVDDDFQTPLCENGPITSEDEHESKEEIDVDTKETGELNEEQNLNQKKMNSVEQISKSEETDKTEIKPKNTKKALSTFKGPLLHISPAEELYFGSKETGEKKCLIVLTNVTKNIVAFKVRTTAPEKYRVKPSNSSCEPGTSLDIIVSLHGGFAASLQDRFLIMAAEMDQSSGAGVPELTQFWKEVPRTKVMEHRWRFTFYLYIFTYGVRFLKKTPWLWNTRQCWNGYPYQPLMPDLHYYYIVELSFYWSLMFSQFIDIKRKDFGIMFTHHILAVTLLSFSYVTNLIRVGTLMLCLHDASDIVLEAAKMANYCKCQKLSDLLFVTFAIVFIVSRLGIYPLWILNTTLFELYEALGNFPALWVFNVLLVILQILNCFWSYLIIKVAYKAVSKGKVTKDDRSDIESSSDEEETVPRSKTLHSTITTNGTSGANGTNGYLTGGTCSEEH